MVRITGAFLILFIFGSAGIVRALEKFDGEIQERDNKNIQCTFRELSQATRPLRAAVYKSDRLVHLPGTDESLIVEWRHVGEILLIPPFKNPADAILLSEKEASDVSRGCLFKLLPNRAPLLQNMKLKKSEVAVGGRLEVLAQFSEPEEDGVFFSWEAERGQFLHTHSRSPYNYFLAPQESGKIGVRLVVKDIFGSETKARYTIPVIARQAKELYQLRHSWMVWGVGTSGIQDGFQSDTGQIYLLEKNRLGVFSNQGFLQQTITGAFQSGYRLVQDRLGYLYILDAQKKMVLKMNRDGKLLATFKDESDQGDFLRMEQIVDFVVRRDGALFMLDQKLCRVVAFDVKGRLTGTLGAKGMHGGQWINPVALTFDNQGLLYVVDQGTLKMNIFNRQWNLVGTVKLSTRFLYTDFIIDPVKERGYLLGNLKVKSSRGSEGYVTHWDLGANHLGKSYKVEGSRGSEVRTLALDLDGDLLVTLAGKNPVLRVDPAGRLLKSFLEENISKSSMLQAGPFGNVFFESENKVKRMTYDGWVDRTFENDGVPIAMTIDVAENVYLVNRGEPKIKMYNAQGQHVKDIRLNMQGREKVLGLGADGLGNLYLLKNPAVIAIYDMDSGVLKRSVDLSTLLVKTRGQTGYVHSAVAYAVDAEGGQYVVDKSNKSLFVYQNDFTDNFLVSGGFSRVKDLAVDGLKNIYVLENAKKTVLKYSFEGQLLKEINLEGSLRRPSAIAAYGEGELLIYDEGTKMVTLFY